MFTHMRFSCCLFSFFFFKQKTAYEMSVSDWSSDVCSSDLFPLLDRFTAHAQAEFDVGHHIEVREQGERLEDQADVPLVGRNPLHPFSPDPDLSSVWLIE